MEKLYIRCPHCGQLTHIQQHQAQQTGRCPGCWRDIVIPSWEDLTACAMEAGTFCSVNIEGCLIRMVAQNAEALDGHPDESRPLEILPSLEVKPWQVGQVIAGQYRVLEVSAHDPTKAKVQHLEWDLPLYVKAQHLHWPTDTEKSLSTLLAMLEREKQRFIAQVEEVSALGKHPHLVTVYFARIIDGIPWLFEEFVAGVSLAERLRQGPWEDLKLVLDLAIQLCRGLAFLHQHDRLHLRLTPNCVLIGEKNLLQIGGFCPFNENHLPAEADEERLRYVAPETWRMVQQPGPGVDIYTWAMLVYAMLCGEQPPWEGGTTNRPCLELYREWHLHAAVRDPCVQRPEVPAELGRLLLSCLAKNPGERPKSFTEILTRLLGLYEQVSGAAYRRDVPDDKALQPLSFNNRALGKLEMEQYQAAEDLLEQAVASDPKFFAALFNLNLFRLRSGKIELSTFLARTAELLNLDEARAVWYRSLVCLEQGGFLREAFEELKRIQERRPEERRLLHLEGELLFRMEDFQRAFPIFERLVQDEEADGGDWYRLGAAYLESGEQNNAHNAWRMGLEMEPEHCELRVGLGVLQGLTGDYEQAAAAFQHVLDQHPLSLAALLNLAELKAGRGIYQDAPLDQTQARLLYEQLFAAGGWIPRAVRGYVECGGQAPAPYRPLHQPTPLLWSYLRQYPGSHCLALSAQEDRLLTVTEERNVRIVDLATGHTRGIWVADSKEVMALALNTEHLVAAGEERCLKIWPLDSGQESSEEAAVEPQYILSGHTGAVTSIVTTPDQRIISASQDEMIRIWQVPPTDDSQTLSGHMDVVTQLVLSPDGQQLLSSSLDKTVRVWDLASGDLQLCLEGHSDGILCLAITPDGSHAISAGLDKTIRVWNLSTGKCQSILTGHTKKITALAVSPDGYILFSGSEDRTIRIWELASGQCLARLEGHLEGISALVINSRGDLLFSASASEVFCWKNLAMQRLITTWRTPYIFHGMRAAFEDLKIRRQVEKLGRRIRSYLMKGKIREAIARCRQIQTYSGYAHDPQAQQGLLRAAYLGGYRRRDLRRTWLAQIFQQPDWVACLAVTPDGHYILTGSWDNKMRLWGLQKALSDPQEGYSEQIWTMALTPDEGVHNEIWSLAISPDGRIALTGSNDGTVRIWQLPQGICRGLLEGHQGPVKSVVISPDGKMALSGSSDSTIRVWSLTAHRPLFTLQGHEDAVSALALGPDGTICLSASADHTLRIWNARWGVALGVLEGHQDQVQCVAIGPQGRRAVSGSRDQTLRIWDLEKGQTLGVLEGHSAAVTTVAISPDGRFAVSGSQDNTLRIWDLDQGYCLAFLEGHTQAVAGVLITADMRFILSGSQDKTLRVWELDWEIEPASDQPLLPPYPKDLYRRLLKIRRAYEAEENWIAALGICRNMLVLSPDNAKLHHNQGRLLTQLQRYQQARDSFRRALRLDPKLTAAQKALEKLEK